MKKTTSSIIVAVSVLLALILFGVWYYSFEEGWSYVDSFYFTVATITTVGYGDITPSHDASKIITAIYSLISIPTSVFIMGALVKSYFETRLNKVENRLNDIFTKENLLEKDVKEVIEDIK